MLTRREMIALLGVGAANLLAGCAPRWTVPQPPATPPGRKPHRFAPAMWDFSGATRRWRSEAEYADWDRVLDHLKQAMSPSQQIVPQTGTLNIGALPNVTVQTSGFLGS